MTDTAAPSPFEVACPVCFSKPHEACTAPTDTGQKTVQWTHLAREVLAVAGGPDATD